MRPISYSFSLASLFFVFSLHSAFASSEGVNRWSSHGPAATSVTSIAVDPVRPTVVYAAAGLAGLFRSDDGGGSWKAVSVDPTQPYIGVVAVDPSNATTLYAGSINDGTAGPAGGALLYKSMDGGSSWVRSDAGLPAGFVNGIAVAPSSSAVVYATAHNYLSAQDNVFRSDDAGMTWVTLSSLSVQNLAGLAVDLIDPLIVYAAAIGGHLPNGGVFRGTDGGRAWSNLGAPVTRPMTIVIDPSHRSTLYSSDDFGNLARSSDGGNTWSALTIPLGSGRALIVDPVVPTNLYVGGTGVFRSVDSGQTWTAFSDGLAGIGAATLAMDRLGLFLHAGTSLGVFDYEFSARPLSLIGGRFQISLLAIDQRTGRTASGYAVPGGDVFGYFSIPALTGDAANPEVAVKILDGRPVNGSFWVFYGGLTDLEYTLTVTDTISGTSRSYRNPPGSTCGGFDTAAF